MNLTKTAKEELEKTLGSFNHRGAGIHLFSTDGCCGPSIQMDIAAHIGSNETAMSLEEIDFFIANDLMPALDSVTLNFDSNGFRLEGLKNTGGRCG